MQNKFNLVSALQLMSFMQTIKCANTAVQPEPELATGNYCDSGIILYFLFGFSFGLEPKSRPKPVALLSSISVIIINQCSSAISLRFSCIWKVNQPPSIPFSTALLLAANLSNIFNTLQNLQRKFSTISCVYLTLSNVGDFTFLLKRKTRELAPAPESHWFHKLYSDCASADSIFPSSIPSSKEE